MTFHRFSSRQLPEGGPAGGLGAGPGSGAGRGRESVGVVGPVSGPGQDVTGEEGSGRRRRLLPPAFPPGYRRGWVHSSGTGAGGEGETARSGDGRTQPPGSPVTGYRSREAQEPAASPVPDLEVAEILETVAREIRDYQGGRFLWKAGVSPLEGAIRGFVAGYLRLGRREGERP